jgi:hypothetical protein
VLAPFSAQNLPPPPKTIKQYCIINEASKQLLLSSIMTTVRRSIREKRPVASIYEDAQMILDEEEEVRYVQLIDFDI